MQELFSRAALQASPPRFEQPLRVRFQDVDAAGVVFFPRILELFHDVYVAYLDARGAPLPAALRARAFLAPIRRAEADFIAPLRFGDGVRGCLVRARIDRSELWLGHRLAGEDGSVRAVGLTIHAFVDPATFRRAASVPESMTAAFAPLLRA